MATTATTATTTPVREGEKKKGGEIHLHVRLSNYESMVIDVIMKRLHMVHRAQAVRYAVREVYKTLLKVQKEQKAQQQQQQKSKK